MLEDRRTFVRTNRRDERRIGFQLVEARACEIDDEAILASRGTRVDDVATDEGINDPTELRLGNRRTAETQPILQIELRPAVHGTRQRPERDDVIQELILCR